MRFVSLTLAFVFGASLSACAESQQREAEAPTGTTQDQEAPKNEVEPEEEEAHRPDADIVLQSEAKFSGVRRSDGKKLSAESLMTHLAAADAICIGERHSNPSDHFAEYSVIRSLLERRAMRGFELGVGLEMVRAEYQRELSSHGTDAVPSEGFEKAVQWKTEWGFPVEFYRPQLDEARVHGASLLALGVDQTLTADIAKRGIAALDPERYRRLPALDFEDAQHRALFDDLMTGHPHGKEGGPDAETMERYYEAQVVWDEAMANTSAAWLRAKAPGRKLIILAGVGHCHHSAIPSRVEKRGGFTAVSLLPMGSDDDAASSEMQAKLADHYDYHLVLEN